MTALARLDQSEIIGAELLLKNRQRQITTSLSAAPLYAVPGRSFSFRNGTLIVLRFNKLVMKNIYTALLISIFITASRHSCFAFFFPVDVDETFDGKRSRHVEFIQIIRRENSVEMIKLEKSIGIINWNASIIKGSVTSWASPSTARCMFETTTGTMLLNITFTLLEGEPSLEIEDLTGSSTSTSILSGKTINKVYSISKQRSHTIEIEVPAWLRSGNQ
jgi:hypothetical protein